MEVAELAPGLWRWTVRHPDWTPEQGGPDGWEADVGCLYCEADGAVLLVDPLVPVDEGERDRFWAALDRDLERANVEPDILLTCPWHARSSADVLARVDGGRLWAPADGVDELPNGLAATDPFRPGESLPGGVVAIDATLEREVLFWLPSRGALVAGDTLLGDGAGGVRLCPDSWLGGRDPAVVRAELWRRVRELPVERVLVSHGEPVLEDGGAALERALS
jgi:glyoxylase-like metal-dependent hydrolase (beta-lactamase superfamily II)